MRCYAYLGIGRHAPQSPAHLPKNKFVVPCVGVVLSRLIQQGDKDVDHERTPSCFVCVAPVGANQFGQDRCENCSTNVEEASREVINADVAQNTGRQFDTARVSVIFRA